MPQFRAIQQGGDSEAARSYNFPAIHGPLREGIENSKVAEIVEPPLDLQKQLKNLTIRARLLARQVYADSLGVLDEQRDLQKVLRCRRVRDGATANVQERVSRWMIIPEQRSLWISCGSRSSHQIESVSIVSANIVLAAQRARLPVFYHFCSLNIGSTEDFSRMNAMLMSLIVQALDWLEDVVSFKDYKREEILRTTEAIRTSMDSEDLPESLCCVFRDTVAMFVEPPLLILDVLDRYQDDPEFDTLLDFITGTTLDERSQTASRHFTCKTLLTTQSICMSLADAMLPEDRVNWSLAMNRGGARKRSGGPINLGRSRDLEEDEDSHEECESSARESFSGGDD